MSEIRDFFNLVISNEEFGSDFRLTREEFTNLASKHSGLSPDEISDQIFDGIDVYSKPICISNYHVWYNQWLCEIQGTRASAICQG